MRTVNGADVIPSALACALDCKGAGLHGAIDCQALLDGPVLHLRPSRLAMRADLKVVAHARATCSRVDAPRVPTQRNGPLARRPCLEICLENSLEISLRVSDRTRTGDRLDHNQELYQLSYAHQGWADVSGGSGRSASDLDLLI
jgi:hypothetical protein